MNLAHCSPLGNDRRLWGQIVIELVAVYCCAVSAPASGQDAWELTPYRIKVVIAASDGPAFTARQRAALESGLVNKTDALVGASWQLECVDAPVPLRGDLLSHPERTPFSALVDLSAGVDKLVLVALAPVANRYAVQLCEWDVQTQQAGPLVVDSAARLSLAEDVFRLILKGFQPLAKVEAIDAKTAQLQFRAAAIPLRTPAIAPVAAGKIFRVVLRTNDRDGKARAIQPLEWTYLTVEKLDGVRAICRVDSGLRSPLARRRRGRLEQYALPLRPLQGSTRLLVHSRTEPGRALAGYDVLAYGPDSKETIRLGRTGRDGGIDIPRGEQPLRLLLVQHGGALVARLPIVPGELPTATVLVPDDDRRLEAEGLITGLQENLVDLVVRRAVLSAQTRDCIADGKLEEAGKLIDELRRLRTQQQFLLQLEQERQRLVSDDPVVQQKINKLFDDTTKVLGSYLLPREIETLETEWVQARQQAGQAPGAPPAVLPVDNAPPPAGTPAVEAPAADPAPPPATASPLETTGVP